MKKLILFFVATFFALFAFTSCTSEKEEEGVFNPKKKISKIYSQYDDGTNTGEKILDQVFIWEKDLVTAIENSAGDIEQQFEYNKSKQLVKISSPYFEEEYITVSYNDSKIEKMEFIEGETAVIKAEYKHSGNKITELNLYISPETLLSAPAKKPSKMLKKFLSLNFSEKVIEKALSHSLKKAPLPFPIPNTIHFAVMSFEWSGKNVSKITVLPSDEIKILMALFGFDIDFREDMAYQYDNKQNPFYGFYSLIDDGGTIGVAALSKNNVTSVKGIYSEGNASEEETINYTYEYEKNFPIKQSEVPPLWSSTSWHNNTFYEYK